MIILGVSCFYHDAAAVLVKDGELVSAIQEERFTRKKHDYRFPLNSIRFLLKEARIPPQEIDYVIFYEKPFLKFERVMKSIVFSYPFSGSLFYESMLSWFREKLWIKYFLQRELKIPAERIFFSSHHLSHAGSAFLVSPFHESAILTVDGAGEWATCSMGIGKGNNIKILKEIHFPHSLGLFYSTFTSFLGFEVNDGELKLMALAGYGKPEYKDKIYKTITLHRDGSFELNMDFFSFVWSAKKMFSRRFIKEFGEPCGKKINFGTVMKGNRIPDIIQYYVNIAASVQSVLEDALLNLCNALYRETRLENLCLAGGVAFNCVANYKILKNTPFKRIFIPPSPGDAGGAMGAAFYLYNAILGKPRRYVMRDSRAGYKIGEEEIKKLWKEINVTPKYFENDERLLDYVVDALIKGKTVGWVEGRSEWGPRALGARSILADPRKIDIVYKINEIKKREPFRPYAPSILQEKVKDFFELEDAEAHFPTRFMLYAIPAKEICKSNAPAVVHVDGTSRLQAVNKEESPLYYRLIKKFEEATGCPVLLNTSLNLKGEPIANNAADCYNVFMKSPLDILVIERWAIEK